MIYSELGNTGLEVSKICLGTMTFGEQNSEKEGFQQLDYAIDQGVNFIDTAEMYSVPAREDTMGATETIIGNWLKLSKVRQDLVIATKITGPGNNFKYMRGGNKYNAEQIKKAVEGSLARLQTDYIDLYQLHWPERKTNYFGQLGYQHDERDIWQDNFIDVLQILQKYIEAGKIRHIGVSNETSWGVMRMLHLADKYNLPRCVSVQNPYSLLNRTYEEGLAEISIRERCGLLAYSPLAFGVLAGKYMNGASPKGARLTLFPRMKRYSGNNCIKATEKYFNLAKEFGVSLATMALSYVNQRPFLTSNIIGATTMEQLKENILSIEFKLSEDQLSQIDAIHAEIPNPAP